MHECKNPEEEACLIITSNAVFLVNVLREFFQLKAPQELNRNFT